MSAPRLAAAFGLGSAARGGAEKENAWPERGAADGAAAETSEERRGSGRSSSTAAARSCRRNRTRATPSARWG